MRMEEQGGGIEGGGGDESADSPLPPLPVSTVLRFYGILSKAGFRLGPRIGIPPRPPHTHYVVKKRVFACFFPPNKTKTNLM
jgi:hypothetical protein